MKKLWVSVVLALVMVLIFAIPALAQTEEWELSGYSYWDNETQTYDIVSVTYLIDTKTLNVSQFNVYNYTDYPIYVYVTNSKAIVWDLVVQGNTTYNLPVTGIKFRKMPHSDPDDPDSVRYPANYEFGSKFPY